MTIAETFNISSYRRRIKSSVILIYLKYILVIVNIITCYRKWYYQLNIICLTKIRKREQFDGFGDHPRVCPNDQVDEEVQKYLIENVLHNDKKEMSNKNKVVQDVNVSQYRNQFFDCHLSFNS